MKKRKIEETIETCDICYQETTKIVHCFKECTIKTCYECLEKQIKIKNVKLFSEDPNNFSVTYTCSMCKHKSIYISGETSDEFTKWVRENALCSLFDKFITIEQPEPPQRSNNILRTILADDEADSLILSTIFDTYIPPANLLPWPYRLIPPPYNFISVSTQGATQEDTDIDEEGNNNNNEGDVT